MALFECIIYLISSYMYICMSLYEIIYIKHVELLIHINLREVYRIFLLYVNITIK